jgi:GMP synthase-like glutamine amidotransferase
VTRARSRTRVGVLACDHVSEKYRAIGGDYTDMFRTMLATHVPDAGLELVPVDVIGGERPSGPDQFDGWLCTGSRHSVYDELPWIADASAFVREVHAAGVPFVGVCFGHQLLAQALGGRAEKAATGWGAGVERVVVDGAGRPPAWMTPPAGSVALHFMHQDQVVEVPPGGEVLGAADHCPVAMVTVGPRALGVQAHPEFTPAYTDALLADRVARIGEAEVAAARAGLDRPTDEVVVAGWMARLLATR